MDEDDFPFALYNSAMLAASLALVVLIFLFVLGAAVVCLKVITAYPPVLFIAPMLTFFAFGGYLYIKGLDD